MKCFCDVVSLPASIFCAIISMFHIFRPTFTPTTFLLDSYLLLTSLNCSPKVFAF